MSKLTSNKKRIMFYLPMDQHEWIKKYAGFMGMPYTEVARRAIEMFRLKEDLKLAEQGRKI